MPAVQDFKRRHYGTGETYPDLVPPGTAIEDIPARYDIQTLSENETEIGWRSDLQGRNRFGLASGGFDPPISGA